MFFLWWLKVIHMVKIFLFVREPQDLLLFSMKYTHSHLTTNFYKNYFSIILNWVPGYLLSCPVRLTLFFLFRWDVPYCFVAVLTGQEQYFLQTESITSWMGVKFGLAMEVWQRLWLCLPKHLFWMRKLVWWIESLACREDVKRWHNQLKHLIPNIFFLSHIMHQHLPLSVILRNMKQSYSPCTRFSSRTVFCLRYFIFILNLILGLRK